MGPDRRDLAWGRLREAGSNGADCGAPGNGGGAGAEGPGNGCRGQGETCGGEAVLRSWFAAVPGLSEQRLSPAHREDTRSCGARRSWPEGTGAGVGHRDRAKGTPGLAKEWPKSRCRHMRNRCGTEDTSQS